MYANDNTMNQTKTTTHAERILLYNCERPDTSSCIIHSLFPFWIKDCLLPRRCDGSIICLVPYSTEW